MVSETPPSRYVYPVDDRPFDASMADAAIRFATQNADEIVFLCITRPFPLIAGAAGQVYIPLAEESWNYEISQAAFAKERLSGLAAIAQDHQIASRSCHVADGDLSSAVKQAVVKFDACGVLLDGMAGRIGDRACAMLVRKLNGDGISVVFAGNKSHLGVCRRHH